MSYCKKCYVDSKKAGIIEENGVYFLGSFVTAWNDGTAPVGNRFGFLKFSRLNAGTYTESVAEIENRFGKVAEEGTAEFAQIREAAAAKKAASTAAPAQGAMGATSSQGAPGFADPMAALAGLFSGIEQNVTNKVMEQVNSAITEILANQVPQRVEHVITLPDGSENKMKDKILHPKFDTILKKVAMGDAVYMYGPAGSGKNILAGQVAEALGLDFYYCSTITQEYKIEGFIDAGGRYHETEFYKAFRNGGLFMLDEIDASCPEALIILNNALEAGYFTFPCGVVKAHEKFRCIAAGNTCGHGATIEFNGRMKIDEATLNRFSIEEIDYCDKIEESCSNGDSELVDFIHEMREASRAAGMYLVLGYRNIKRIAKYVSVFGISSALESEVIRGMENDDIRQLIGAYKGDIGNKYYKALKVLSA